MSRAGHACHPPCDGRAAAMRAGTFGHVAGVGWIDYTAPKRRSAPVAIVRHALGKHPDLWGGWPYTWTCCPWCGGDLDTSDHGEGEE